MAKKKLVPVPNGRRHFFAASFAEWRVDSHLEPLIKFMEKQGNPYHIYLVPVPITAKYPIENYKPMVPEAILIDSYES